MTSQALMAATPERRGLPRGIGGLALYVLGLIVLASFLPTLSFHDGSKPILLGIGALATWRYSWGLINFIRSMFYREVVFPRWRGRVEAYGKELDPSHVYILMTLFRIETETSTRVVRAAIQEAIRYGGPVTIVASIVELQDEFLFKTIFSELNVPDRVHLRIVRSQGSGKRDGLHLAFKAISRDLPDDDAVVVVMDGDTILLPGLLRRTVPFFRMMPKLGALTTDEIAEVHGSVEMSEWHDLRFAQRHLLMSSISLSKRVMTLTGRMSVFRASIVVQPGFIDHVVDDHLDHWRLGRFKFLTGDDKSSLYWVLKEGWEQIYVPDTRVLTLEDPPSDNFVKASTQLMFRWFGNMLRTNDRVLKLGPSHLPMFVWWAFVDQRISMWTSLAGPVFAIMLTIKHGPSFLAYYIVWIGFIRLIMTLMLLTARNETSWRYPFLLYYGQVYGALIKTWVMFRLDKQSWTRQKTALKRGLTRGQALWNEWSSHIVHVTAVLTFISIIGFASEVMNMPHSTVRTLFGMEHHSAIE